MPLYSLYTSTIRFRHGLVEVGVSSVRPLTVATRLFQFANIQSCLFLYEEHWTTRMECAILEVQPQSSVPMERWLFASSSTAADGVSSTRPKSGDINACMVSLEVLSFFFQPFASPVSLFPLWSVFATSVRQYRNKATHIKSNPERPWRCRWNDPLCWLAVFWVRHAPRLGWCPRLDMLLPLPSLWRRH